MSMAKHSGKLGHALEVIEELGIDKLECYPSIDYYSANKVKVVIQPSHTPGIGIFTDGHNIDLAITDTTPVLAQIARLLLPKVGKFEKGFNQQQNMLTLTCTYRDVILVLTDAPPKTCTVERVEEEVDIPEKVVPAHKEKKVRYVMVGDCDPLMQTHIETSQGSIEIPAPEVAPEPIPVAPAAADEDIPF